jgi:N utilization substance protein B
MQSVYALLQSKSDDLDRQEKFLRASIERMYDLFAVLLQLLIEIRKNEENHISLAQKKYLATSDELNPNTRFIDNRIFRILEKSPQLAALVEKKKLNYWELDSTYVTDACKEIKEHPAYASYMKADDSSFEEDREFLMTLFREIIAPNEKLADYFEDKSINWIDDIPFVNTWIVKLMNHMRPGYEVRIGNIYKDDDDEMFVSDLFRKVVLNHTELEKYILDKTPNWDTDRIAGLDLILIKMAICEFLYFPSIPTRVTINEYIEIAKDYSTDKSSYFINGVLDKILKELTASKSLNKSGRGLL